MESNLQIRRWVTMASVLMSLGVTVRPSRAAVVAEAWGRNAEGEFGNGKTTASLVPVAVSGLVGSVTAIAGGSLHSLAVQNGGAFAWGYNAYGEIGNGTTNTSAPYGINTPVGVSGLSSGVTTVVGGNSHSLAVMNGGAWAWGYNGDNELGNGTSSSSSLPVAVSGLIAGVTGIACGTYHSLAIQNGGVWSWGSNDYRQLGIGRTVNVNSSVPVAVSALSSGVTLVAGGGFHSLAVQNGGLWAWGNNSYGQLGNNSMNTSAVPVAVSGLSSGVTAIAGGYNYSLAVRNGSVWTWGANDLGQLGDGTTTQHLTPEQIDSADLHDIVAVAANTNGGSSYALSSDGTIWDWGYNAYGQLGLGNTTDSHTPRHLLPPSGYLFTSVSSNQNSALATLAPIPEPTSLSLLALAALALRRRRRT